MKLYEFTFEDNTNLSESEVLKVLMDDLKSEAELQGWASGYNLRQRKKPKQLSSGKTEYYFEVDGEYIASGQSGDDQDSDTSSKSSSDIAAAPF